MSVDDTQASGTDAPQVDTAEPQSSEASTQIVETPEATPPAQGAETEVKAEDTVGEKLFAGKYKTVEDLENAYKNAESKLGQIGSDRKAELERALNQGLTAPADTGFDESTTVNPETEKIQRDMAALKFMTVHNDVDPETIKDILTTDPIVAQINGYDAKLEYAYLRSQNMAQSKAIVEAEKRGAETVLVKTAEKQTAQVESGRKAEQINESSELFERATGNYTREERDKARLALIRKNLVDL